jgi:hypothetical protein
MRELFERADFVKFAKFIATDEENASALPVAVRFVTETYQAELEDNAVVKDDAQTAGDVTLKENEKEGGE